MRIAPGKHFCHGQANPKCDSPEPVLDTLGLVELREYIDELKAEIARVEADIDRKQGHRSAADAFFRRP